MQMEDTIAALATPVGESGVGIIRLSGPQAIEIAAQMYRGKDALRTAASHTVHYGYVYNVQTAQKIDEALFLLMRAPHSFTGEDVAEIQCHGGMVVLREVLELAFSLGARPADRGEFSKRAFLHGRLDLAQAESIMDLVQAKCERGAHLALSQLEGALSAMIRDLRAELMELIAFLQADIDYPDDDIERLDVAEQAARAASIRQTIREALARAEQGKLVRDGLEVVIAGRPNVGKSSLLNALAGQERAIVTDIPGTTRDAIEVQMSLDGILLRITDTAGLRETDNPVEQIGVERTGQLLKRADLVLFVADGTFPPTEEDAEILRGLREKEVLYLLNKADLGISDVRLRQWEQQIAAVVGQKNTEADGSEKEETFREKMFLISARTGEGIPRLEQAVKQLFFTGVLETGDEILVTNARHIQALKEAEAHLEGFLSGIEAGVPSDFLVIDLQSAWEKLGCITGDTVEEDLLDQIFSKFCLGK